MNARNRTGMLFILFAVLVTSLLDLSLPHVREAHAVVGRPLTPVSYAGVARRTTRRAYYGGYYGAPVVAPAPYYW